MMASKNIEIERKFLVIGSYEESVVESKHIVQGYLCRSPQRTVRIRICDDKAYMTVKGAPSGISRFEWEKEISLDDAQALLALCEPGIIDKTRSIAEYQGHRFEIDGFHGQHEGLIVAEIELDDEDEAFEKPEWLGKEVTHDINYTNAVLSMKH